MKSLLRIVLLIVLIVAGAGAYLYQQEGNLDVVFEMLGLASEKPVQVATPAPRPRPPVRRPAPAAKAESVPPIAEQPVQGAIRNIPFTVETAEIENGVLTLRQGEGPSATEIRVYLHTKPWTVPAERRFQILDGAAKASDSPLVRIRWQEAGQQAPRQRDFTEKYTLRLEFGRERDRVLPGKIQLVLPDEDKSRVEGSFSARVRGFRFIDGKPDLASDSVDTLQYLALREILKDDPDRPIDNLSFRHGRYQPATESRAGTGYLEMQYQVGDAEPILQKFQFVKEQNAWRLLRALRPDQLDEAHPYHVPGAKDAPERLFPYLAAQRIEADVQKRQPGAFLHGAEFGARYNDKLGVGIAEVSYKIGDGQLVQTAFLYRRGDAGWKLVRELDKKERLNLANGWIETRH
ncbi:MAG TPA: hypothetical protein VF203_08035 [Burkholderiales bacterium]